MVKINLINAISNDKSSVCDSVPYKCSADRAILVDTDESKSSEWHRTEPYGCSYVGGSDETTFSHIWEADFENGETLVQFVRILSHNSFIENNAYGITAYIDDQVCGTTPSRTDIIKG